MTKDGSPAVAAGQERIESWAIDTIRVSRIRLPHPGMRTVIRASARNVCLVMQKRGVSALEQSTGTCCFDPGQWSYWMGDEAQQIPVLSHSLDTALLALEVPRDRLTGAVDAAVEPAQMFVHENNALVQTVRDFAFARGGLDPAAADRVATLIARTVECVILEQKRARLAATSPNAERLNRVRQYILARLPDPQLSFTEISDHAGCSKRFVQMMFAECGETVRAFILRNRLVRVHLELLSSRQEITHIAVAHGFNDHSHFSRVYRKLFGVTPSNTRRASAIVRAQRPI